MEQHRVGQVTGRAFNPLGLPPRQAVWLGTLTAAMATRRLTPNELAESAHIAVIMSSQGVRKLEPTRLVERAPGHRKGRAAMPQLTSRGRDLVSQAATQAAVVDAALFAAMDPDVSRWTKRMPTCVESSRQPATSGASRAWGPVPRGLRCRLGRAAQPRLRAQAMPGLRGAAGEPHPLAAAVRSSQPYRRAAPAPHRP